jgi:hypothetical protein
MGSLTGPDAGYISMTIPRLLGYPFSLAFERSPLIACYLKANGIPDAFSPDV